MKDAKSLRILIGKRREERVRSCGCFAARQEAEKGKGAVAQRSKGTK